MAQSRVRLVSHKMLVDFHGPADITLETTEAIVNAANSSLLGGGGVDGAIHDAGGPSILDECKRYVAQNGILPAGQAMLTGGGRLAAKYVIHTVGPVYRGGRDGEHEVLASCYRESLRIAEEHNIRSLAFPSISTGAYRFPARDAATIAIGAVLDALEETHVLRQVRFVLFDVATLKAYTAVAEKSAKARPGYKIEAADPERA